MDRVEILNERRTDKLNRLKLIENDMNQLKAPMEEAVEYLKLENSIAQIKNILYQKKLYVNIQLLFSCLTHICVAFRVDLEQKQEKYDTEKKEIVSEQKEFIKELQTIAENRKKQESVYNTSHK